MNFRGPEKRLLLLSLFLFASGQATAGDLRIEKQKVKFSLEYENFVDEVGNEVRTPGPKVTFLLKAAADIARKMYWSLDLQTGLKANLDTTFLAGDLSPLAWSNRVNLQASVPLGKFYAGGGFYFRNKWLAQATPGHEFVDVFGGVGFREVIGTLQGGVAINPDWDVSGSFQASDETFADYPLSDSSWRGATIRINRKFRDFRLSPFFRARNVHYNRPVFSEPGPIIAPFQAGASTNLQQDLFREGGVGVEFSHPFYFAGTYSYQVNNSNNPGFSFHNHQVTLLVGAEIAGGWYLQAYGIVQRYDFLDENGFVPFPLLLGENDDNNMAASIVRTLGPSTEIELGIRYLTHDSSFVQLNVSKTILYAACNYRF